MKNYEDLSRTYDDIIKIADESYLLDVDYEISRKFL